MYRLMLILTALTAGLFISDAGAAPGEPFHVTVDARQYPQTVEQQGHITNNTNCIWDADDRWALAGQGIATDIAQLSNCAIVDWAQHLMGLEFWAPGNSPFIASVWMYDYIGERKVFSWPSVKEGGTQHVKACLLTPDFDRQFTGFLPVDDGVGIFTRFIWNLDLIGDRPVDVVMNTQLIADFSNHQQELCGTYYTIGNPWPHCEGDPFVDGRVCYQ